MQSVSQLTYMDAIWVVVEVTKMRTSLVLSMSVFYRFSDEYDIDDWLVVSTSPESWLINSQTISAPVSRHIIVNKCRNGSISLPRQTAEDKPYQFCDTEHRSNTAKSVQIVAYAHLIDFQKSTPGPASVVQ